MSKKLFIMMHFILSITLYLYGGLDAFIIALSLSIKTLGLGALISMACLRMIDDSDKMASSQLIDITARLCIILLSMILVLNHFHLGDWQFVVIEDRVHRKMLEFALIGHLLLISAELLASIKADIFHKSANA
jgi:hypothetical protein